MDDILANPGKVNAATTGPGGLPQEVVDYLTEHFDTVMQKPEIDEIQQNLGTFPLLASSIMVLSSLIMMGEMRYLFPSFDEGEKENRGKAIWNILFPDRMASVIVLVVIYAVLLPHVGFTIATAGFLFLMMMRLKAGKFLLPFTQPILLFFLAIGTFVGTYIGAIPGLSVTMAVSLLISFTFSWDMLPAIALMIGINVGGVYDRHIAACLQFEILNTELLEFLCQFCLIHVTVGLKINRAETADILDRNLSKVLIAFWIILGTWIPAEVMHKRTV